jgi:hypothetical protein
MVFHLKKIHGHFLPNVFRFIVHKVILIFDGV